MKRDIALGLSLGIAIFALLGATFNYIMTTDTLGTHTDNSIIRFDGTSGVQIQGYNSGAPTISDDGQLRFPGGIADLGPRAMVVVGGDNHTQDDTYVDFKVLVDRYQIPFTIWVERRPGHPISKALDPDATDHLTNTELIAMSVDPLWEIGAHTAYHAGPLWTTAGYVNNPNSANTVSFNTPIAIDVGTVAVDDLMWFYGGGGAQYLASITNDNHFAVNASPGMGNGRQFYHIADDTETGTIDCDGDETATVSGADPNTLLMTAPTFSATGLGGMIWIEGSSTGNPYYILDYDTATNVMTLNRDCTDANGGTTFHLANSVDGLANDLMENIASIRTDIGDSEFQITSFGAPRNAMPIQEVLLHMARGITVHASSDTGGYVSNSLAAFNRNAISRIGGSRDVTPEELRNMVRATIDTGSAIIFNLESEANAALYDPTSLGSVDGGTATEWDCDDADCDFDGVGAIGVNDVLIIDDPLVTKEFTITAVATETLTVSEDIPAGVSAANFWIIDDAASVLHFPFETAETLFSFINDNRDKIMPLLATEMANRADMINGNSANLIRNPYFRITDGSNLGVDEANVTAFRPWNIQLNGNTVTRVERFGTPMLKVDTSGGSETVDIVQDIPVNSNRRYILWSEVEVESLTSATTLSVKIEGLEGSMQSNSSVNDSLYAGGSGTKITADTGNNAINTYTNYLAFSTEVPQYMFGYIVDGAGAATGPTRTVGFNNQQGILSDGGGDDGVTTINFPAQVREPAIIVQAATADRYCATTTRAASSFVVSCYDNAGTGADSNYSFTILPEPARAMTNTVSSGRTIKVLLRFVGQGVIYWRPPLIVEDTNWIER